MRHIALLFAASLAVAPMTLRADDVATYDSFIEVASRFCPDHSIARTTPGIRNVTPETLQALDKHGYFLCPDRRIKRPVAVVWYPNPGLFEWNPSSRASVKALRMVTAVITHANDFPDRLTAWDAQGKELTYRVVPMFEPPAN